jgi:hypothetical protein
VYRVGQYPESGGSGFRAGRPDLFAWILIRSRIFAPLPRRVYPFCYCCRAPRWRSIEIAGQANYHASIE